MRNLWNGFSPRERLLVMIAAAILFVFVIIQFVVTPFVSWRTDSIRSAERAEDLYTLVSQASAVAPSRVSASGADLGTPLRNVLTQTARPNSIELNFVNARQDGTVDASAGATDPDQLFQWLSVLKTDYGVSVMAADISREEGSAGLVRAQLTFTR